MPDGLRGLDVEPVATLATIRPDGLPHLVPITFAIVDDTLVWAVDSKPKTTPRLARIRHLERDPRVSVLISHYDDDWDRLWWARLEGTCRILEDPATVARAVQALQAKYDPYRNQPPPGPFAVVTVERVIRWAARGL